jgi:outer membrane protein TolC
MSAQVGVAIANMLPSLTLTPNIGYPQRNWPS